MFPSVVVRASALGDEQAQSLAAPDTVTLRGTAYWVGRTALIQGEAKSLTGLDRDWVFSEEHDVLLLAAVKRAITAGFVPHSALIVIGLPAEFYSAQRKEFAKRVSELMAAAKYERVRVKIQQQPYGVLQTLALTAEGQPAHIDLDDQTWAVVDVGEFTTDVLILHGGQIVERSRGSFVGVKSVKDRLSKLLAARSLPNGLVELNDAVQKGHVRQYGQVVDVRKQLEEAARPFEDMVINECRRLFGDLAERLDGVAVAGGGAELVRPALAKRFPHDGFVQVVPDSRLAIAEGFCRFGLYLATKEQPLPA
jgi:plasmid segregation protein ParM